MNRVPYRYIRRKIPSRAFTLIELLVVISVISMLASVVIASLTTARSKARDTQRIAELRQVQNALELYRNDNGSFPIEPSGDPMLIHADVWYGFFNPLDTFLFPVVGTKYIAQLLQGTDTTQSFYADEFALTNWWGDTGYAYALLQQVENNAMKKNQDCPPNMYAYLVNVFGDGFYCIGYRK